MLHKSLSERKNDYALKVVPESAREWSLPSLVSVTFGITTALFFFLFGGLMAKTYGMTCLVYGMIIATLIGGSIGFILAIVATETGLDIDLITSGSCIGYKGASITSLIYAISFIIYFAIEGSIIAESLHNQLPFLPLWLFYIIICLTFALLTWYGITIMNFVMWISLPIYMTILIWSLFKVNQIPIHLVASYHQHSLNFTTQAGPALLQLLVLFIPPIILNAMIAADIGRFIPKKKKIIGAISLSYLNNGLTYLVACLLGAWLSLKLNQPDPGVYFPAILGILGTVFVLISQIRINIINTYSGSLAFATFFSRSIGFSPGRQYWVILLAAASFLLMFGNILNHLHIIMTFLSVFLAAWVMTVLSDVLLNRNLFRISSANFHVVKGRIPDYNPIGLIPLTLAIVISLPMAFGLYGPLWKTLAPCISAIIAFSLVPLVAYIVKHTNK